MSVTWNPWHGCQKISEGCRYCYVYRIDEGHGKDDSSEVRQTANFALPIKKKRDGSFKIPSGTMVYTCFSSDFFVAAADEWRSEAWNMIKLRNDLNFFIITKRIDRFFESLPSDWGNGYDNVAVGCTVENQKMADYRLPIFNETPIKHKLIIAAPLIGQINMSKYLNETIESVSVGGESGNNARICDYSWILDIRRQCEDSNVSFRFHQTGAKLVKDGRLYRILRKYQHSQAHKANIDFSGNISLLQL